MERFYFNSETLQYNRITFTRRRKLIRFLISTGLVAGISFGILIFNDTYLYTPKLNRLMVEQQQLSYELNLLNQDISNYESELNNIAFTDDYIYRVFFEVEPWPASLRNAGVGGSYKYRELMSYKYADRLVNAHLALDNLSRKLVIQSKSFDEIISMARSKEERMAARPAIQPVSIKDLRRFGSAFGIRMHPILKVVRPHNGIDLTAPRGTNIYATADGTVIQAGYTNGGYGKKILVDHGFGYRTLYGHCNQILVKPGQAVKRGEVIGLVGSTGLSTTPHLHYEVHVNGHPVNPINYYANDLSAGEYEKMIKLLSDADPSFDIN